MGMTVDIASKWKVCVRCGCMFPYKPDYEMDICQQCIIYEVNNKLDVILTKLDNLKGGTK